MVLADHHEWVANAADRLVVSPLELWRALASSWTTRCCQPNTRRNLCNIISAALGESPPVPLRLISEPAPARQPVKPQSSQPTPPALIGQRSLFGD